MSLIATAIATLAMAPGMAAPESPTVAKNMFAVITASAAQQDLSRPNVKAYFDNKEIFADGKTYRECVEASCQQMTGDSGAKLIVRNDKEYKNQLLTYAVMSGKAADWANKSILCLEYFDSAKDANGKTPYDRMVTNFKGYLTDGTYDLKGDPMAFGKAYARACFDERIWELGYKKESETAKGDITVKFNSITGKAEVVKGQQMSLSLAELSAKKRPAPMGKIL